MKKLTILLTILSLAAISFAFATSASTAQGDRIAGDKATASAPGSFDASGLTQGDQAIALPDAHADACRWNRDNCLKGCDGATSCSNQCWTNYNNCMKQ